MTKTDPRAQVAEFEERIRRLEKINRVLMERAERGMDLTGGNYSLFLTATVLEQKVKERTGELEKAMGDVESTNQRLTAAKERAEEAVRSKDAFLAGMGHELRTPLNSMLGRTESLLDGFLGAINQEQRATLGMIDASGRHLLELINDILDLAKVGAGEAALEFEDIELNEICRTSLETISVNAMQKGIRMSFETDPPRIRVRADSSRVQQLLLNLLRNAVKYTDDGGSVSLSVRVDEVREVVCLAVTDAGIGISTDHMERLFEPFVQVDSGLSRGYDGTGLGLTLVKEMVELHDGTVSVESEPGVGSTFIVELPWSPGAAELDAGAASAGGHLDGKGDHSVKVLLADDNPANVDMFERYLTAKGFAVIVARDGAEAVQIATRDLPDVILMDIQMPGMDGLEATRRLRADDSTTSIPIIALTALAMPGDRDRCLKAGATDYLSKPVSLKNLVRLLRAHVSRDPVAVE